MMLTFTAPAELHGDALTAELAAAGLTADIYIEGDTLYVSGTDDRAGVQKVLAAHVPPPPSTEPDLAERLAAVEARLDKAANAAVTGDAAKLRDNLKPIA